MHLLAKRLPFELILYIAEHAARQEAAHNSAWVASLALVCRSVRAAVEPILYHTIEIRRSHVSDDTWVFTSNRVTSYTRTLVVTSYRNSTLLQLKALAHACSNLEILMCSFHPFRDLHSDTVDFAVFGRGPTIRRPSALLLPDSPNGISEAAELVSVLASITHLALPLSSVLQRIPEVANPTVTHVLIGIDLSPNSPHYRDGPSLTSLVASLLSVESLVRIVCCAVHPEDYDPNRSTIVRSRLTRQATLLRDSRIAFDEKVGIGLIENAFVESARQGFEAWDAGVVLYSETQ
ncbi:hypothetical protein EXIGLDRAFT_763939 [Exidia glandulosa HHB12029]|uniref:F-box domain-containing protein n=1 Tax=Exidia glandulosa HHB12029 TaxID=1314781 RepID=A0A165LMY8_EXIGL|nr:hypothetical protein EXIGLDRAFT_763939 [Exidia glandulosa HHB12029]